MEERVQQAQEAADAAGASASEGSEQDVLSIYGFSDVAFRMAHVRDDSSFNNVIDEEPTFLLGNVNVYLDAKPSREFRALTEVRFTTYPNGTPDSSFAPIDNSIYDVGSATGRNRVAWSGIVLERAWVGWVPSAKFGLRAGYLLTPYGIWNLDHGSPTLISSVLPGFFASEYFPTHMLGLEAFGIAPVGDLDFGYHAYVSNGRNLTQADADANKNLGGRAYVTAHGDFTLTLGASGFYGTYAEETKSVASVDPFRVDSRTTVAYQEVGLGADVSFDYGALRIRAEVVGNRQAYEEGKRDSFAPGIYVPDRTRVDTYGLVAYRLPWLGLEPYLYLEYDKRAQLQSDSSRIDSFGLNVNFSAVAKLKLQFSDVHVFAEKEHGDPGRFQILDTRFVVAY